MLHELKTDPAVFEAILRGDKLFDIRYNDRGYAKTDRLDFRETMYSRAEMDRGAPMGYTGRRIKAAVTYILRGPAYGLEDGFVCMSIKVQSRPEHPESPSENAVRALSAADQHYTAEYLRHLDAGRIELAEVFQNRRTGLQEIASLLGLLRIPRPTT